MLDPQREKTHSKIDDLFDYVEEKLSLDPRRPTISMGRWSVAHLPGYDVEVIIKVMPTDEEIPDK